ncbi:MAG: hypothetical protein IH602_08650 [Bryobacteraceae bacterium]|nr:hypothetical protein [Bryobacteraceae bacterium]
MLTEVASRAAGAAAPKVEPKVDAGEMGKAVALLSGDLETSAALMAKVDPNHEAAAARGFLAEAGSLPQPGALAGLAGESGLDVKSLVGSMLGDLTTEESLLNAYFTSSKFEIERACIEKTEPAADPFRVPARATKRTKGAKK